MHDQPSAHAHLWILSLSLLPMTEYVGYASQGLCRCQGIIYCPYRCSPSVPLSTEMPRDALRAGTSWRHCSLGITALPPLHTELIPHSHCPAFQIPAAHCLSVLTSKAARC